MFDPTNHPSGAGGPAPASEFAATPDGTALPCSICPNPAEAAAFARALDSRYGSLPTLDLLSAVLREVFPGRIALVSSFGTESAVLLDLVAQVDPATPVLFLDTGQLFEATLRYRDTMVARLGLTDARVLRPNRAAISARDVGGMLWRTDADACCHLRKVVPLELGLTGFAAWITGRKRFQGGERGTLAAIEADETGMVKINPLARWTPEDIARHFQRRGLPRHEMEIHGYRSIGCRPCTVIVDASQEARAGRWRDSAKTECGIHRRPSRAQALEHPPTSGLCPSPRQRSHAGPMGADASECA